MDNIAFWVITVYCAISVYGGSDTALVVWGIMAFVFFVLRELEFISKER